jgi:hypothetical protein
VGGATSPLVSVDPVGSSVIGWQEYTSETGEWSVVVREFDAGGKPTGPEREVERSKKDYLALERLGMDGLGNFEVVWQRALDAKSRGHFSRKSDRATKSLGNTVQVARGDE